MELIERLTRIENTILANAANTKDVLTFDEACVYTGMSHSCMYKLTSSRKIEHFKPNGKMIYFRRKALEAFLLQNRIATDEEISAKASAHTFSRGKTQNKRN